MKQHITISIRASESSLSFKALSPSLLASLCLPLPYPFLSFPLSPSQCDILAHPSYDQDNRIESGLTYYGGTHCYP